MDPHRTHVPAGPGDRPFDACVGLGYHCKTTYQLRRITGVDRAHFFDWLDLDLDAVTEAVRGDFRDVLRPGAVEPFGDGRCALDRGSDIRFFHDFSPSDGERLTQADIDTQLPGVRAKFAALAERWRELAASPAHVLHVHLDAFDEASADDVRRLRAVLAAHHPGHACTLLWLRRTPPADADALPPGILPRTVAAAPGRWQGDDHAWDAVFGGLRVPRPALPEAGDV
ncbi:papain-like cysteine peptidase [Streptomyces diastaticus]|uniref:papain-like cysteine peptidase n=1 Tax=Streptomyces diastaticus TaxID=1956 RepID=UPI0035E212F1